ncbi:MAG: Na-translocating system protein MpsC family protein [Chitinophagales bacterium]
MRVLIAEDEFVSRRLLLGVLSALGECDTVNNGAQALTAIREAMSRGSAYRLLCLDLLMPEVNGLEVLVNLRGWEREQGITEADRTRVIVTTAVDELPSIAQAFQAGCDAYLTKPVDRRKLQERLRELELLPSDGHQRELGLSGEAKKRAADEVSALLRRATGKGPMGVKVYVDGHVLTLVIEGALTPLERTLLQVKGAEERVTSIRAALLESIAGELRSLLESSFELSVADLYSHVDPRRDKQIIVARVQGILA